MPGRWYDPRPFFDNRTLTLCPPRRPAGRRGGSAVLARDDTVIPSQSEAYQYDTVNRLTQFTRGTPGGTGATPTATWTLDALGNWRSSTANGVETDRTHNAQNQVATVRAAGSPTPTPLGYDADGNTLADNTGQQYAYDAWNRLVTVKNGSGTTLAAFTYDAQGRRVTEAESGTTTALYYSKNWQVLETRQAGTATQQYVWSPFYVDGLVERDDHTPAEAGTALDRRLYAEQDADDNVTSLTDATGQRGRAVRLRPVRGRHGRGRGRRRPGQRVGDGQQLRLDGAAPGAAAGRDHGDVRRSEPRVHGRPRAIWTGGSVGVR